MPRSTYRDATLCTPRLLRIGADVYPSERGGSTTIDLTFRERVCETSVAMYPSSRGGSTTLAFFIDELTSLSYELEADLLCVGSAQNLHWYLLGLLKHPECGSVAILLCAAWYRASLHHVVELEFNSPADVEPFIRFSC